MRGTDTRDILTNSKMANEQLKSEKYHRHKHLAGVVPLSWHEIESCPSPILLTIIVRYSEV